MHYCNDYCLRKSKVVKSSPRCCRVGAGKEQSPGKCNTPGFPFTPHDDIKLDKRGFKKLNLKHTI